MSERAIVLVSRLAVLAYLVLFWGGVVLWCSSCAAASVGPDGSVRAVAAMGGSVERCIPTGEAGVLTSAPEACTKVEAQSLPSAVFGFAAQALTALWGLL